MTEDVMRIEDFLGCEDDNSAQGISLFLEKVRHICKVCSIIVTGVLILSCFLAAVFVCLLFFSLAQGQEASNVSMFLNSVSPMRVIVIFALAIAVLFTGRLLLDDVVNESSPFSQIQAKRIRRIAFFLLVFVVFEVILSPGLVSVFQHIEMPTNLVNTSMNAVTLIPFNLGIICAAGGLICLSFVFEYGVLLQKQSDETL